MVLIPAGEFEMGSTDGTDAEKPIHTVYVDAFYMDTYEVTNAQYKQFVDANPEWQKGRIPDAYHHSNYLIGWNGNNYPRGKANYPVIGVSWYAAMAYSKWTGKRLPTEAEWEKAARGGLVGMMRVFCRSKFFSKPSKRFSSALNLSSIFPSNVLGVSGDKSKTSWILWCAQFASIKSEK